MEGRLAVVRRVIRLVGVKWVVDVVSRGLCVRELVVSVLVEWTIPEDEAR